MMHGPINIRIIRRDCNLIQTNTYLEYLCVLYEQHKTKLKVRIQSELIITKGFILMSI